jgi:hypothetical protein
MPNTEGTGDVEDRNIQKRLSITSNSPHPVYCFAAGNQHRPPRNGKKSQNEGEYSISPPKKRDNHH